MFTLFEDGIEVIGIEGTKFALVGVSREILLRRPKAQERGEEAGAQIGSGSALLAGLMRKPIRRKAARRRREGKGQGGGREGAIVFILMRQKARLHLGISS